MITPCIKVCVIDKLTEVCIGCGRTLNEIAKWSKYTDDQREEIMYKLKDRLVNMTKRKTICRNLTNTKE